MEGTRVEIGQHSQWVSLTSLHTVRGVWQKNAGVDEVIAGAPPAIKGQVLSMETLTEASLRLSPWKGDDEELAGGGDELSTRSNTAASLFNSRQEEALTDRDNERTVHGEIGKEERHQSRTPGGGSDAVTGGTDVLRQAAESSAMGRLTDGATPAAPSVREICDRIQRRVVTTNVAAKTESGDTTERQTAHGSLPPYLPDGWDDFRDAQQFGDSASPLDFGRQRGCTQDPNRDRECFNCSRPPVAEGAEQAGDAENTAVIQCERGEEPVACRLVTPWHWAPQSPLLFQNYEAGMTQKHLDPVEGVESGTRDRGDNRREMPQPGQMTNGRSTGGTAAGENGLENAAAHDTCCSARPEGELLVTVQGPANAEDSCRQDGGLGRDLDVRSEGRRLSLMKTSWPAAPPPSGSPGCGAGDIPAGSPRETSLQFGNDRTETRLALPPLTCDAERVTGKSQLTPTAHESNARILTAALSPSFSSAAVHRAGLPSLITPTDLGFPRAAAGQPSKTTDDNCMTAQWRPLPVFSTADTSAQPEPSSIESRNSLLQRKCAAGGDASTQNEDGCRETQEARSSSVSSAGMTGYTSTAASSVVSGDILSSVAASVHADTCGVGVDLREEVQGGAAPRYVLLFPDEEEERLGRARRAFSIPPGHSEVAYAEQYGGHVDTALHGERGLATSAMSDRMQPGHACRQVQLEGMHGDRRGSRAGSDSYGPLLDTGFLPDHAFAALRPSSGGLTDDRGYCGNSAFSAPPTEQGCHEVYLWAGSLRQREEEATEAFLSVGADSRGQSTFMQTGERQTAGSAENIDGASAYSTKTSGIQQNVPILAIRENGGKVSPPLPQAPRGGKQRVYQNHLRKSGVPAWSAEEDAKLAELVARKGFKWALISSQLTDAFCISRTGKQCRERWFNHVNPEVKKGDWSTEEDATILALQNELGNRWATIAKKLPGRTENAVKNRFISLSNARLGYGRPKREALDADGAGNRRSSRGRSQTIPVMSLLCEASYSGPAAATDSSKPRKGVRVSTASDSCESPALESLANGPMQNNGSTSSCCPPERGGATAKGGWTGPWRESQVPNGSGYVDEVRDHVLTHMSAEGNGEQQSSSGTNTAETDIPRQLACTGCPQGGPKESHFFPRALAADHIQRDFVSPGCCVALLKERNSPHRGDLQCRATFSGFSFECGGPSPGCEGGSLNEHEGKRGRKRCATIFERDGHGSGSETVDPGRRGDNARKLRAAEGVGNKLEGACVTVFVSERDSEPLSQPEHDYQAKMPECEAEGGCDHVECAEHQCSRHFQCSAGAFVQVCVGGSEPEREAACDSFWFTEQSLPFQGANCVCPGARLHWPVTLQSEREILTNGRRAPACQCTFPACPQMRQLQCNGFPSQALLRSMYAAQKDTAPPISKTGPAKKGSSAGGVSGTLVSHCYQFWSSGMSETSPGRSPSETPAMAQTGLRSSPVEQVNECQSYCRSQELLREGAGQAAVLSSPRQDLRCENGEVVPRVAFPSTGTSEGLGQPPPVRRLAEVDEDAQAQRCCGADNTYLTANNHRGLPIAECFSECDGESGAPVGLHSTLTETHFSAQAQRRAGARNDSRGCKQGPADQGLRSFESGCDTSSGSTGTSDGYASMLTFCSGEASEGTVDNAASCCSPTREKSLTKHVDVPEKPDGVYTRGGTGEQALLPNLGFADAGPSGAVFLSSEKNDAEKRLDSLPRRDDKRQSSLVTSALDIPFYPHKRGVVDSSLYHSGAVGQGPVPLMSPLGCGGSVSRYAERADVVVRLGDGHSIGASCTTDNAVFQLSEARQTASFCAHQSDGDLAHTGRRSGPSAVGIAEREHDYPTNGFANCQGVACTQQRQSTNDSPHTGAQAAVSAIDWPRSVGLAEQFSIRTTSCEHPARWNEEQSADPTGSERIPVASPEASRDAGVSRSGEWKQTSSADIGRNPNTVDQCSRSPSGTTMDHETGGTVSVEPIQIDQVSGGDACKCASDCHPGKGRVDPDGSLANSQQNLHPSVGSTSPGIRIVDVRDVDKAGEFGPDDGFCVGEGREDRCSTVAPIRRAMALSVIPSHASRDNRSAALTSVSPRDECGSPIRRKCSPSEAGNCAPSHPPPAVSCPPALADMPLEHPALERTMHSVALIGVYGLQGLSADEDASVQGSQKEYPGDERDSFHCGAARIWHEGTRTWPKETGADGFLYDREMVARERKSRIDTTSPNRNFQPRNNQYVQGVQGHQEVRSNSICADSTNSVEIQSFEELQERDRPKESPLRGELAATPSQETHLGIGRETWGRAAHLRKLSGVSMPSVQQGEQASEGERDLQGHEGDERALALDDANPCFFPKVSVGVSEGGQGQDVPECFYQRQVAAGTCAGRALSAEETLGFERLGPPLQLLLVDGDTPFDAAEKTPS